MVFLGILALGFVSLSNLAIDLFPKIDLPIAVVSTSYNGAAPQEVEKLVTEPVEGVMSSIEGIDTIQSQSMANASLVILMFQTGTDLDNALIEVREKVDQIKAFLPEGANDPSVLRFDPQQTPVMWVSLAGDEPETLQKLAEDTVAPYFERSKGVASVSISGGKTREVQVELDQALLAQYGLSATQVIQSLGAENISASAGTIAKGSKELQVRINGEFESVEDIEKTTLMLQNGGKINLGDIAEIKDTFKEESSLSIVNNKPAIVMSIMKQSDGNTVETAEGVQEAMEELREQLPERMELTTVIDTSTFIKSSITSVTNNMILAAVLSIFVIFLFLRSIRSSIVIGISIPISLISTFVMMYFAGETLNILSLGGLALGVGMMVDNAIVILENIVKYRKQGYSIKDAAITGTKELSGAVIASTTTTLVVFLPIVFVQGLASDLFTPLALSVSFSLIASLVVSLTLVPMLSSKLLTKEKDFQEKTYTLFDRVFASFEKFYKKMLRFCLGHRKTTLGIVILTLIASVGLATQIGATFIPQSDQGQLTINVETPTGSSLSETERVVTKIEERLAPIKDIVSTNYVSVGAGGFDPTAGGNTASFTIQLVPASDRELTTVEVGQQIRESVGDIPGAEITVSEQSAGLGGGSPVQIQINGEDQEILEELSQQVIWLVSDVKGVENPATSATETRPEIQVLVNREVASQYGLTYQQVMSQVQLGFNGQVATRYREGGEEIDIKVIFPEDERSSISDLETMLIQTPMGTTIPLSSVAELVQVQGPSVIARANQQRQVNVTSDVEGVDIMTVSKAVEERLQTMNFPEGYTYTIGGQTEDMMESFKDLGMALIFSIFLVYTVMAIQFESFRYPLVIMFSMPTAIIGVVLGLFVTGLPFSVPAFIGVIMLAGIVVNNAIVLVDYINILRGRGMERDEAILEAGPSRLQPILMTTMTTVLGMIPLGLALGEGAEAQQPMAIVIIFGLTFSMFLTLLFVPVMYTFFDKKKKSVVQEELEV